MYKQYFIDNIKIYCKSGNGGDGLIHFKKNKFFNFGPDGGHGGNGGHVIIKGNHQLKTLSHIKYNKNYFALNGNNGKTNYSTGSQGKNCIIEVPLGTVVKNKNNILLFEIIKNNEKKILFMGGKGGYGNCFFKKSYCQTPRYYQIGNKGQEGFIFLELKLLSDIGIIGFPNSGKSTLLSKITSAKPKIGNYPFTTIRPNIGIMYHYNKSFIISDIPGIIKNSVKKNKGLGIKFLKHLDRISILLLLIPADSQNIEQEYNILLNEIYQYNPIILKKKRLLIISKIDLLNNKAKKHLNNYLINIKEYYIFISSFTMQGINNMKNILYNIF